MKSEGATVRPGLPRLLLIEDHFDLAKTTAEFLGMLGLEVQITESGNRAIAVASMFSPEIVLCDLHLPDMSGFEVVRRFRSNPGTKDVLFAIYTAMSKSDIVALEEKYADEVDMFLSKPFTATDIEELLRRFHDHA